LKSSLETELYKVDRFVRLRDQDSLPAPLIHAAPIRAKVDLEVARHVVWGGAVARRAQTARDEKREKAPVLLYHSIASTGPDALRQYRVSPELFGAQMRWLRRHGYYTIHSAQLAANIVHGKQWEGRPVLISFDDGFQNFAEEAWPRLQEHDFFAEMFVPTDHVGKCAKWDSRFGPPAQLMDCHTITRLSKEGVFFGSHLASHRASRSLSTGELAAELARSRNALEHWTGRPVNSFAAPYGSTDFRLRQLAAEIGFQTGFSTAPGAAKLADDPLELPRIEVRGDLTLEAFAASMEAQL
jgi:peptidoglycan/xylan/chitin deacetylase (PgdA/CDA1 family)